MRLRRLPLVTVTVALTVLGGCNGRSSGATATGPLAGGAYGSIAGGSVCAPARVGQPRTFGIERFTNHGHAIIVLDSVALLRPHNERLTGSYAVPGSFLIGVAAWPPSGASLPSTWPDRESVHGFRLSPGKKFVMALGVTATAAGRASSAGLTIRYHDPSGSYVLSNGLAMIIKVGKSC